MKIVILAFIGILTFGLGMDWLVEGNQFLLYKFFAPKRAAVEREVFENTKSFISGTINELQSYQFEYIKANQETKNALAPVILHKASNIEENKLPYDLRSFISSLKNQ